MLHKDSLTTKIIVIKTTITKIRINVIRITIGTLGTMVTTLTDLLSYYVVYLLSNEIQNTMPQRQKVYAVCTQVGSTDFQPFSSME